ncbi:mucin-13-like [Ochotona curzoniae]|uniref:mucin-13-like n=1 Tax=Ochotona curzoniae TaxID=130825 RepID=UPI001B347FC9|nr:mucin-13-like [Ochotona curzoniae]
MNTDTAASSPGTNSRESRDSSSSTSSPTTIETTESTNSPTNIEITASTNNSTSTDPPTTTDNTTSTDPPTTTDNTTSTDPPTTTDNTTSTDPPTTTDNTTSTDPPTTTDNTTSTDPPTTTDNTTSTDPPTTTDNTTSTDPPTTTDNTTSTDPPTTTDNTTSVNNTTVMTTNLPTSPGTTAAGPSDPCKDNPCNGNSSCVPLNTTRFCLCVEGYYYNSQTCQKGRTFPGEITLKNQEISGWENKTSAVYQDLHQNVTEFFKDALNGADYGQTVILKVSTSPSLSARSELLTASNPVVKVMNVFFENSTVTENDVTELIEKATTNSPFVSSYTAQNLCDFRGCVNSSDNCTDGLTCTCKEGLERPNTLASFCVATCPRDCNAENNKQCLMTKEDEKPTCVCLAGYRNNNGICQKCSFGYSGVNCENPFQLILTIVGTIAGFLILILVIAVICSARSNNKGKNIEEQNLIDNDFHGFKLQQTTGFTNMGADGGFFPRVKTGASQNVHPQNPYSNPRSLPGRDY